VTELPAAFFSYVHSDDEHDGGQIQRLRDVLEGEVQMQLGEKDFQIFIDRDHIKWGQKWRRRIDESLEAITLLIPILTPAFLASKECRREVEEFLAHERKRGRDDLILPIYYVGAPQLDDPQRRDADPLASELATRQYADWRELRFEPFTSSVVRQRVAQLAGRMRDSFWRFEPLGAEAAAPPSADALPARHPGTSVAAAKHTAAERVEPPTLTVDPWGHGEYTTIGDAVAAAEPGTRILVRAGLYEEGLEIDKPLEIVGQGAVEDVIVRARGCDALVFKANIGRVSNLTLQQAGGDFFAADIVQGRLELENCDITSVKLAAVAVHGSADPRVRGNLIHDGEQGGVFVYDQGLGTFEDNEIVRSGTAGIEVKDEANPTIRRNRIYDGKQGGVRVADHGLGTFEDNDIFANAGAGISVKSGGNPTVRRNRINRNGYEAIWVFEGGGGTFEDNDLTDNARGAWDIAPECEPNVRRSDNRE
jgi:parallel beta-helix repeat protein